MCLIREVQSTREELEQLLSDKINNSSTEVLERLVDYWIIEDNVF